MSDKVAQPDLAGFKSAAIGAITFIKLGSAVCEAADIKLVEVTIGPSKGCLYHLVELSQVEVAWQFKPAADGGMDVDDMDIGLNDGVVGFEHGATMARCWRGDK